MNPPALPIERGERVVVGLSGGVDSAVTAMMLRDAGAAAEPVFMKNWEEDDREDDCSAAEDLAQAEAVCSHLGLRLRTVNFSTEYWDPGLRAVSRGQRRGADPQPRRVVQPGDQVRGAVPLRRRSRGGSGRHRALCANHRARGSIPPAEGPGPGQGPVLLPVSNRSGFTRPSPLSGRRSNQGRGAWDRGDGRSSEPREAEQHRDLLHRRTSVPAISRPLDRPRFGAHRDGGRRTDRNPRGPRLSHRRTAPRPRHRRPPRRKR